MQEEFFDWGEAIPAEKAGTSVSGCSRCKLQEKCKNPKMKFEGDGEKKILILFENPTKKEDKKNLSFIDDQADTFREYLEDLGFDLETDCWYGYAVSCHVPRDHYGNIKITDNNIGHCQEHLYAQINRYNPRVIIPMGDIAIKALLKYRVGGRLSGIKYHQYKGHSIPDQDWGININPTYSIDEIYDSEDFRGNFDKVMVMRFKQHIHKAFEVVKGSFYKHNYDKDVFIYFDKKKVIELLKEVLEKWEYLYFDYETTGLKPQADGHKIYTIGISDGMFGHAFPFFHDSPRFRTLWKMILESKRIKKVAHNAKFEKIWSLIRADADVQNFYWCTMIAEHIQHNKSRVGAKFLYYVYLGVLNMDGKVDKYLKATDADEKKYGNNAINQIDKIWKEDPRAVLKYQGEDALYLGKLHPIQETYFDTPEYKIASSKSLIAGKAKRVVGKPKMRKAFEYFHEGTLALGDVELTGIKFNVDKCDENLSYMNAKVDSIWKRTLKLPDAEGWSKNLTGKRFQSHLYDTLKYPVPTDDKDRKPGNRPEGEEALEEIGTDFTKKIIMLRKQTKIKTTIEGYFRECVDGIIRPSYGTGNVDTFRTSANSPNIQNPFKRNKHAKKMLREMIVPSPGRYIVGKDYKAIEVSIAGCIFPDDAWLEYCINWKTSDMHRDCSAEILRVSIDQFKAFEKAKDIRQEIKNKWVFPNIYGSGAPKMGHNIFEAMKDFPEAMDALSDWGYTSQETFKNWIKEYYRYYWEEKYPDYKAQRDKAHVKYEKLGYIDSPVGYRYYGPMSYNDFCNYPVQGSAAAIKIWAIKEINKELVKQKMDSRVIYEIHDEIGGDVVPDERKEYDLLVEDIATVKVREYWPWIITPLVLETEESEIDGDWSEMEEK